MKVLIIGGTGLIGRKITALAAAKGYECSILSRGLKGADIPENVEIIKGDRYDPVSLKNAVGQRYFDVVVDQTCYNVGQAKILLDALGSNMGQLVFTSTACVYTRPFSSLPVTEACETNPPEEFEYGYSKYQTELYLLDRMSKGGPNITIIRPSHTFGESRMIGFFYNDFSLVHRLRNRKPIICPGNGQSVWTLTYTGDIATGYVGTFGNKKTFGQAYHLTTEEFHTWEDIISTIARVAGAPEPELVYIPTRLIYNAVKNERTEMMYFDKMHSAVFDNSKARRDIPGFATPTRMEETVRKAIEWFEEDCSRKLVNESANALEDRICKVWKGIKSSFSSSFK